LASSQQSIQKYVKNFIRPSVEKPGKNT